MTSYADFVTRLGDLDISGVPYQLDEPPTVLNDLPAQWVQFPRGDEAALTFGAHGGWPTLSAQLIIAYEAVGQGSQASNFAGTVAMMDAVVAQLRSAVGTIAKGNLEWTIRVGEVLVGEISYWAVIVEVTGHG